MSGEGAAEVGEAKGSETQPKKKKTGGGKSKE